MKKSKIIIPALAIIAFSTAASIAGSVAWFTASRTASIDAGTYAVVKTNADLAYDLTEGVGTKIEENETEAVSLDDNKLTDGSVNHTSKKAFAPNAKGDDFAEAPKGEVDLTGAKATIGPNLERGTFTIGSGENVKTKKIYTAVTWEVKFTVSFGGVPGNVGLFLDCHSCVFTPSATNDSQNHTAKGFRIAFMPKAAYASAARSVVIAPLEEFGSCSYVNDHAEGHDFPKNYAQATKYDADDKDLMDSEYFASEKTTSTLPADGTAAATAVDRKDYLGTFVYDAGNQVDLEFICVAWFEGTDANIVNQDNPLKYQSVGSTLVFNAIDLG